MNSRVTVIRWQPGVRILLGILGVALATGDVLGETKDRTLTPDERQILRDANRVYVDVAFSTWMPRGHTLADVAPAIRTRLVGAGFTVVREKTEAHDLVLMVDYREEQGRQIRFDYYGTDITGVFALTHPTVGSILGYTVKVSSTYPPTGAAPYLDALSQFDTNPYYFLIGDIVAEKVRHGGDLTGGLVRGVTRLSAEKGPGGDPGSGSGGFAMQTGDAYYAPAALINAIAELERLRDPRAVPAFEAALKHPDPKVRGRAVEALGQMNATAAKPAVEALIAREQDSSVQEAAAGTLKRLNASGTRRP